MLGLSYFRYDAVDEGNDGLIYFMCLVNGINHDCFGNFVCTGFNHDNLFSGRSYG